MLPPVSLGYNKSSAKQTTNLANLNLAVFLSNESKKIKWTAKLWKRLIGDREMWSIINLSFHLCCKRKDKLIQKRLVETSYIFSYYRGLEIQSFRSDLLRLFLLLFKNLIAHLQATEKLQACYMQ